jgi:hypothetical protein
MYTEFWMRQSGITGITEASAILRLRIPWTRSFESTTPWWMLFERRAVPQGSWGYVSAVLNRGRRVLTESSLASIQNSSLHLVIRVERHLPGILGQDNVFEAGTVGQNIVRPADTLTHSQDIQIIGKEVEVDVRLYLGVRVIQSNLAL